MPPSYSSGYGCLHLSFSIFAKRIHSDCSSNCLMLFCHVQRQRRRNGSAVAGPYLFLSVAGTGCMSRQWCRHALALKRGEVDLYYTSSPWRSFIQSGLSGTLHAALLSTHGGWDLAMVKSGDKGPMGGVSRDLQRGSL